MGGVKRERWRGIKTILKGLQSRRNVIIEWVGMTERAKLLKGKPQRMSHLNLLQVGGTFCILSHVYTASMPEVRVM